MYTSITSEEISSTSQPKQHAKCTEKSARNERKGCLNKFETSYYQQIWQSAPESTENKIIFPWHQKSKEYSIMNFHPTLVGNRISYSDISHVMDSLKSEKLYDKEKMIRTDRFWRNIWILLPVITICMIVFAFAEHITFYLGTDVNIA